MHTHVCNLEQDQLPLCSYAEHKAEWNHQEYLDGGEEAPRSISSSSLRRSRIAF